MSAAEPNHPTRPCIVAGFDDTPSGFDAVALARRLAAATDARLIVAYVYSEAISAIDIVPPPELVAERREDALRTVQRASIVLDGSERWEPVVYAAEPAARGLHEVADGADAELIVVGSTHRHGLGRVMPGMTGERLLHGSACPSRSLPPAGAATRSRRSARASTTRPSRAPRSPRPRRSHAPRAHRSAR